jgi:hypothetical protein
MKQKMQTSPYSSSKQLTMNEQIISKPAYFATEQGGILLVDIQQVLEVRRRLTNEKQKVILLVSTKNFWRSLLCELNNQRQPVYCYEFSQCFNSNVSQWLISTELIELKPIHQ